MESAKRVVSLRDPRLDGTLGACHSARPRIYPLVASTSPAPGVPLRVPGADRRKTPTGCRPRRDVSLVVAPFSRPS